MGTEWFRADCAAVSISFRRDARRKRTERGRPPATFASHSAAGGAIAADAAPGGRDRRNGVASRGHRTLCSAGFLTIG
ncbi:hypothetical protein DF054_02395 [Burkholderia cepacia]|nr:hypothetical protein DF055_00960 [Burkholderia cepacia]RRA14097.1 hypothetical protein DF054_02395 [Burkholderia cepacia]